MIRQAKQGGLNITKLNEDGTYWMKSWKTGNEAIKHGHFTYKGEEYLVSNKEELSDSDQFFSSSLKGVFPYKKVAFLNAVFQTKVKGDSVVNFTYDLNYPSENEQKNLIQYLWVDQVLIRLEPVTHNIVDPSGSIESGVEFITNEIEKYGNSIVKQRFKPYEQPFDFYRDDYLIDIDGRVVYGVWNGWVVDDQDNTYYIKNAKGFIKYGTVLT